MKNELLEKLADLEHEQWSHWTKYLLSQNTLENRNRWIIQMRTDYKDLLEKEKDSDREWAKKVVKLIAEEILKHKDCTVMHNLGKHGMGEMTCLDKVLESLGYTKGKSEELK